MIQEIVCADRQAQALALPNLQKQVLGKLSRDRSALLHFTKTNRKEAQENGLHA